VLFVRNQYHTQIHQLTPSLWRIEYGLKQVEANITRHALSYPAGASSLIRELTDASSRFGGAQTDRIVKPSYGATIDRKPLLSGFDVLLEYKFATTKHATKFTIEANKVLDEHKKKISEAHTRSEEKSPETVTVVFFWPVLG